MGFRLLTLVAATTALLGGGVTPAAGAAPTAAIAGGTIPVLTVGWTGVQESTLDPRRSSPRTTRALSESQERW